MGPLVIPAILAGMHVIKSEAFDRPAENRRRQLRAEEQRYSPYSGIKNFTEVGPETNTFGAALGGAAQGLGLGQGFVKADREEAMQSALMDALKGSDVDAVGPTKYNAWLASQNAAPEPATRGFLNSSTRQPNMWESYMYNSSL